MSEIGLHRSLAGLGVGLSVGLGVQGNTTNGRQDKSADLRSGACGWLGWIISAHSAIRACWRFRRKAQGIQRPERRRPFSEARAAMSTRDDDIHLRPGRIRHGNQGAKRPKSFVGEVMRAAKKAGHTGRTFGRSGGSAGRSTFGRGRRAALSLSSRSPGRRVVIMTRIVRHQGKRSARRRSSKHVAYLKREGVTRDGADARMFDARSDDADTQGVRRAVRGRPPSFPVHGVPEDAAEMADLRAFTRELMADAERISARSSTGWRSITGTPTIRTSMCWCAGAPTTARTWSSAATTSARGSATAPPSASPWSWGRAASRKSGPPWRRRSRPSAGPASTARFATSPMRAAVSPTCVPAGPAKTRNCAG